LPEKSKKSSRFSRKAIIALAIILSFLIGIGAVFMYPRTQPKEGFVSVSREENYWMNQVGNKTDTRYLVNYGIAVAEDSDKITISDKTDQGLITIPISQETSKVVVSYDPTTGGITVVVTDLKANDKTFAQVAFKADPVNIFASGEAPSILANPPQISWGDEKDVEITITPFRVLETTNITEVGVYTWFTVAAQEIKNLSTTPETKCDPPTYQAIWQYKDSLNTQFGAHTAVYHVKMSPTSQEGGIVFRTWVEARYNRPLRMAVDGTIKGATGYFFKADSGISYQYEQPVTKK